VAPFTFRPLRTLDALYRFVGGMTGLQDFALESAIQPVHDVSRMAALSGGISPAFGYVAAGGVDVHAGAGSIRTTADPYSIAGDFNVLDEAAAAWLIAVFGTTDSSANHSTASISYSYPVIPNAFGGQEVVCGFFPNIVAETVSGNFSIGDAAKDSQQAPLPLFLPRGGTLNFLSVAQIGAVETALTAVLWVGAVGTTPPGMA